MAPHARTSRLDLPDHQRHGSDRALFRPSRQTRNPSGALAEALDKVVGAYSLLVLTRDEMYALRDPRGFRPLALGKLDGAWIVASETCAFDLIDAEYIRDVEPGEMVRITPAGA